MNTLDEKDLVQENVPLGIIGALVGSLIGVAAIVLLGQLGFVASLAGVVMAVCSLKGYELLAKKMSVKGIIICAVIIIVMTFVAEYLDWAITLYRELNEYYDGVDFLLVLQNLPEFLKEADLVGSFVGSLAVLYLFVALGAVPTIIGAFKEQKPSAASAALQENYYVNQDAVSGRIPAQEDYYVNQEPVSQPIPPQETYDADREAVSQPWDGEVPNA